jgi:hypothetical protein
LAVSVQMLPISGRV